MGLFDRFRKEETREETITPVQQQETTVASDVLLQALLNSQPITREQALTLPAVSGAVDLISGMIASMPIKLYKYIDKRVESRDDDPRVKFLNGDTGDTLDAYQMKKAMVEDYLLGRGGYAYIRRNRNEVTGLFYTKEIYVSAIPNFKPIFKDFYIIVEGKTYQKYEFLKLLRNTKDGATGIGLTQEVGTALETAFNTLLYQLNIVKSGGNKKGFLKSQRKLGQEEINVLKQAWNNLYANNTENVVVLNNGLEFQEASNSSVEMQLNESKKTLQNEINNIFHIYPDDFYRTFKEAIYPIIRAFTTALNKDLLLEKEKNKMFFEFDVKEILKANVKERYEAYKIAKETGWITFNEIRRMENMNYIEGMDTVNVGLGAVLYDTNTHKYYTPNTDKVGDMTDETPVDENGEPSESQTDEAIQHVITDKILDTEYEQEYQRFNPNHDGKTGRFAPGHGGGSGSSGSGGNNGGSSSSSDKEGSTGGSSSSSKSDSSKDSSDSSSDKKNSGSSGGSGESSSSSGDGKDYKDMSTEELRQKQEELQIKFQEAEGFAQRIAIKKELNEVENEIYDKEMAEWDAHNKEYASKQKAEIAKETANVKKKLSSEDDERNQIRDSIKDKNEKAMQEQSDKVYKKMSSDEKEVLDYYTMDGYYDINQHLNGKYDDMPNAKEIVSNMDSAISKYKLQEDTTLYRGVNNDALKNLKVGDTYSDKGYLSTSVKEDIGRKYAEDQGSNGALIKINATKGNTNGIFVGVNSASYYDEGEFLMGRNSEMIVKSITTDSNGMKVYEMEVKKK